MIQNLDLILTIDEIIYSMILAFFITYFIKLISSYKKLPSEHIYPKQKFYSLIKNFYEIFPKEVMSFKGEVFKKGMKVRITTLHKRVYEGEIIGFNHKNVICIITQDEIVTNKFNNIEEISILE